MKQLKASVIYLPDMGLSEKLIEELVNKKLQEQRIYSENYVGLKSFSTVAGRTAIVVLHEEADELCAEDT